MTFINKPFISIFGFDSRHTLVVYHGKSLLRLNRLSNFQFRILQIPIFFHISNFFFKFPIFSSSFQCFSTYFSKLRYFPNFKFFSKFQICYLSIFSISICKSMWKSQAFKVCRCSSPVYLGHFLLFGALMGFFGVGVQYKKLFWALLI